MKSMIVLMRWELRRVLSNWRQTMAVFLIPSIALLAALYVFPMLVDYLSTGNVGNAPVILVRPDAGFQEFIASDNLASGYTYKTWTQDKYETALVDGQAAEATRSGSIIILFLAADDAGEVSSDITYSDAILAFFDEAAAGNMNAKSHAIFHIYGDPTIMMSDMMAQQYAETVLPRYRDFLMKTAGSSIYKAGGGDPFTVDTFNPYTKLMEFRSNANEAGSRVIPGVLILLLYYCIYSLSGDILASDRERGFLAKLTLTPLSSRALLWGKALTIVIISVMTSIVTLFVILLASWFNRSNNPLSLIPFGLLLTPAQIGFMVISIFCAALLMTMYCFKVILDLQKMQDILLNLQLPLLLFLFDFFLQLFRPSGWILPEYLIPIHNNLLIIHDIMADGMSPFPFVFVICYDLAFIFLLFQNARRKFEPELARKNQWRSLV